MTFVCGGHSAPAGALRALVELASCCYNAAADGPTACTCWQPEYDLDQVTVLDDTVEPGTRTTMCADCAYRPGSPESQGDDRYTERPADPATPFWCHTGMRKPVRWRHPAGIVVEAETDSYDPPILVRAGTPVPYKADGTPGDRCAGWAAHRRQDAQLVAQLASEAADA